LYGIYHIVFNENARIMSSPKIPKTVRSGAAIAACEMSGLKNVAGSKCDEWILGGSDFVMEVLSQANERYGRQHEPHMDSHFRGNDRKGAFFKGLSF